MFQERKNTYCVMGDQIINSIVLWPTNYCVMTDQTLCYGRPVKSLKPNIHKDCRGVFSLSNHYITLYNHAGCGYSNWRLL